MGVDLGTSGVRVCIQDSKGKQLSFASSPFPFSTTEAPPNHHEQDPNMWWKSFLDCLHRLPSAHLARSKHIAIDGTSGTIIGLNQRNQPVHSALMYNDQRATEEAKQVDLAAPPNSPARGASSGLAKMLWLQNEYPNTQRFCHQADWLAGQLTGDFGFSDFNNCLKSGFDNVSAQWPEWVGAAGVNLSKLPIVKSPGVPIGTITDVMAKQTKIAKNAVVHAGTTDSIAAFLGTPAGAIGDAVTSLGSTLVIKLISDTPVFAPQFGIYSHRLGQHWLVGGASNTGGAALLRYFSVEQMNHLGSQLTPLPSGLDYYPLPGIGERFPTADPNKESLVTPRPSNDAEFLKGLLEGICKIEAHAYEKLVGLGATPPRRIFATGGGCKNRAWMQIRQRYLNYPLTIVNESEAACGAARLAASVSK